MKLFSKNRLFISLVSSSISSAFLLAPTYAMDPPKEGDQEICDSRCYHKAYNLFQSRNPDEKRVGVEALKKIAENKNSMYHSYAVSDLYYYANNLFYSNSEEDKKIGISMLREIAQDSSHSHYSHAVETLFYEGTDKDKRAVAPMIYKFVQDPNAVNRYALAYRLFQSDNKKDKKIGISMLREIA